MIVTDKNELLVQKRTMLKDYCPGYYELVTGGCIGAGEDDDSSAERELEEELGLTGFKLTKLFEVKTDSETPPNKAWSNVYLIKDLDLAKNPLTL